MTYYRYISVGVIVLSAILIGVGASLAIPGLLVGGVLCLLVGAMISAMTGIRR
jgi:mannose/fructose/N-acetylgalactosamine-specific phosphotransferase system component IID